MPCYKPLHAQIYIDGRTFKQRTRILRGNNLDKKNAELPCGRCLGCRLEYAKEWALRCHHEASMHDAGHNNSFITLTYATENLPDAYSLTHDHFQKFIRGLRKTTKTKVRFYMSGEYGEPTVKNDFVARPHYHAILFGFRFPDTKLVNVRNGNRVYTSPLLSKLWTRGTHEIGSVTFQSAGYVARYVVKKQTGEQGAIHYGGRVPPYCRCSLKPGIGYSWYEKNKSDLWPHDYAVLPDGRQTTVPRYYRKLLEREDPQLAQELRESRIEKAKQNPDNTPERLAARETCKKRQTDKLIRSL